MMVVSGQAETQIHCLLSSSESGQWIMTDDERTSPLHPNKPSARGCCVDFIGEDCAQPGMVKLAAGPPGLDQLSGSKSEGLVHRFFGLDGVDSFAEMRSRLRFFCFLLIADQASA
jgi:hypothetical protein